MMEVKFPATQEVQMFKMGRQYVGEGGDDVMEQGAHGGLNYSVNVDGNNAL